MLLCDSQLGGYTCFGKYMGHSSVEQTWNYIRDIVEAKEKSLEAQIFNSSRIPARARDGARRPVDVCFAPTGAERRPRTFEVRRSSGNTKKDIHLDILFVFIRARDGTRKLNPVKSPVKSRRKTHCLQSVYNFLVISIHYEPNHLYHSRLF